MFSTQDGLLTAEELHMKRADPWLLQTGSGHAELRATREEVAPLLDNRMENSSHYLRLSSKCGAVLPASLPQVCDNADPQVGGIIGALDAAQIRGCKFWFDDDVLVVATSDLRTRLDIARRVNQLYGTDSTTVRVSQVRLRGQVVADVYSNRICGRKARSSLPRIAMYVEALRAALKGVRLTRLPQTAELERLSTLCYYMDYKLLASCRASRSLWVPDTVNIGFSPCCKREETLYPTYDVSRGMSTGYALDFEAEPDTIVANGFIIKR